MAWPMLILFVFLVLAYHNASLKIWTLSYAILLIFAFNFLGMTIATSIGLIFFILIFTILNFPRLRRSLMTRRLFFLFKERLPKMSTTEKEAIGAGTIGWEKQLLSGNPNWEDLLSQMPPQLTDEEQAFLDGPVEILCSLLNDWEITHVYADLPQPVWQFLKKEGFFGLIIPKEFGGKGFSAFAHSQIIAKIGGVSITAGSTVSVPNSLGPAELLLHYGTPSQKNYYLPRLASGEEIPCFALTSAYAGSDASAMIDFGIVCREKINEVDTLGIRLTFEKRYITLAPIATLIGLAFKLYDPDCLLSQTQEIGITCALIPRDTKGLKIGRRHFPLNAVFQNGPVSGKDIFIPLDYVIGGQAEVGKGWKMLMECLAAGRAISLPSISVGGAKVGVYMSASYASIRKQFNQPIGKFEGVAEVLARMAAYTYLADATRTYTSSRIDAGEKSSVASAIAKYHCTEFGRKVALDAMDIHGGKGICLGPNNYLGRGYQAIPIAITVEGANILTRNMIIFGQGLMRCHPYLYQELNSVTDDEATGEKIFDKVVMKHIAFTLSNGVRTLLMGLTGSRIVQVPKSKLQHYFQHATRFCSALAFLTDISLLMYGGNLKRKESISARLGDILSYLYLLSSVLKKYNDEKNEHTVSLIHYCAQFCLFEIQNSFSEIIRNIPNRFIAYLLNIFIFPWGQHFERPKDKLKHKIANLLLEQSETRKELIANIYLSKDNQHILKKMDDAFEKTFQSENTLKKIQSAMKKGEISGHDLTLQMKNALDLAIIDQKEYDELLLAHTLTMSVIAVDDFSDEELTRIKKNNTE